jgi:hypothetical protein
MKTPIRGSHQSIMTRCYAVAIQVNLLGELGPVRCRRWRSRTQRCVPDSGVRSRKLPTASALVPRTLLTAESDFTDATRSYPPDSTDKANSLNQIAF